MSSSSGSNWFPDRPNAVWAMSARSVSSFMLPMATASLRNRSSGLRSAKSFHVNPSLANWATVAGTPSLRLPRLTAMPRNPVAICATLTSACAPANLRTDSISADAPVFWVSSCSAPAASMASWTRCSPSNRK
jgi:hypothetical protein